MTRDDPRRPLRLRWRWRAVNLVAAAALFFFGGVVVAGDGRPLGWVLLGLGLVVAQFASGLVFDRAAGTGRRWWGVCWFGFDAALTSRTVLAARLQRLRYTERMRRAPSARGGSQEEYDYPVYARADAIESELLVADSLEEARRTAKRVAAYFGASLVEHGSEGKVVAPDELYLPLRERVLRRGEALDDPEPPAGMRFTERSTGSEVRFDLPWNPPDWTLILALCGIGGAILGGLFVAGEALGRIPWLFALGCAGLFLALIARRESVSVSTAGFTHTRWLLGFLPWRTRLASDAFEDVVLIAKGTAALREFLGAAKPGLRALGFERAVEFGFGLDRAELSYLRDRMRAVLAG